MSGSAHIIRANSLRIPLANASVHLAITSPGYFGLRDYRDGGKSVRHQIGAEATPEEHLRALWAVADEVWRTLVDWGSYFVNYGEKYSQSRGNNNAGVTRNRHGVTGSLHGKPTETEVKRWEEQKPTSTRRNAPGSYVKNPEWARPQSLMGLPWAFALGMINPRLYRDPLDPPKPGTQHPQWILRARIYPDDEPAEHIWHKPSALPESVTKRVRNDIETILHFSKSEDSYTAVDEIRKPLAPKTLTHRGGGSSWGNDANPDNNWGDGKVRQSDPRGSLPGSVWEIASEPLKLPTWRVVVAGRTTQWFEPRTAPKSKPQNDGGMLAPTGRIAELRKRLGSKVPQPPPRDMAYENALRYMRAMGTAAGRPSLRPVSPHFAAFPTRLPELIIRGWSPSAICTACGEGRRPVVEKTYQNDTTTDGRPAVGNDRKGRRDEGAASFASGVRTRAEATILGYACACTPYTDHAGTGERSPIESSRTQTTGRHGTPGQGSRPHQNNVGPWREYHFAGWTPPPTRPSVILDPFVGTGTTCLVAKTLGRVGVGIDLSHSYAKIAEWRCASGQGAKAEQRTWHEAQSSFF